MRFDFSDIYGMYNKIWQGVSYFKRPTSGAPELGVPLLSAMKLKTSQFELDLSRIPALIQISGTKRVETTEMAGDFAVNEIIGLNNYTINIKGICIDETIYPVQDVEIYGVKNVNKGNFAISSKEFPEKLLMNLRHVYEANEAVEIHDCRLLNYFNIQQIVIKSLNLPEGEFFENSFAFELQAVSDFPFELVIS